MEGRGHDCALTELINAETHSADIWFVFGNQETIIKSVDPLLAARVIANIKVCSV